jgi:hypothetical protein
VGIIPSSNISTVSFTNIGGTLAIASGGTGATNAANARQNLGSTTVGDAVFIATNQAVARTAIGATTVGSSVFTLANPSAITFLRLNADNTATALSDSSFRTAIGLGSAATNPATAFQPSSSVLTNLAANNGSSLTNIPVAGVVGALAANGSAAGLTNFPASLLTTNGNGAGLTNLTAANITGTVGLASNVTGTIAISNGGSGATTAGGARTNLGLGATNDVQFGGVIAETVTVQDFITALSIKDTSSDFVKINLENPSLNYNATNAILEWSATEVQLNKPLTFFGTNTASTTRTNLGLGWSALTNSNAGTGLVSVNTNGEVVSPTNFWQVAPITTTFIDSQPTTNQTTNIAAGRNFHIHSIAPSTVGITNTIALPTTNSFNGDIALVVHQGPTSSVTAVRTAGAATNLITLNQFEEAVEFVYYNSVWQFNHNRSFVEPIFFSGTNAAANRAASRTNLGLGTTNNVFFGNVTANGLILNGSGLFYVTETNGGIDLEIGEIKNSSNNIVLNWGNETTVDFGFPISFSATTNAAATRTNLGIPLAALTNTNNANFQAAIFNTNSVPTNSANVNAVNFNTAIHWMEVNVVTNGVTNNFRIPLFK